MITLLGVYLVIVRPKFMTVFHAGARLCALPGLQRVNPESYARFSKEKDPCVF